MELSRGSPHEEEFRKHASSKTVVLVGRDQLFSRLFRPHRHSLFGTANVQRPLVGEEARRVHFGTVFDHLWTTSRRSPRRCTDRHFLDVQSELDLALQRCHGYSALKDAGHSEKAPATDEKER